MEHICDTCANWNLDHCGLYSINCVNDPDHYWWRSIEEEIGQEAWDFITSKD